MNKDYFYGMLLACVIALAIFYCAVSLRKSPVNVFNNTLKHIGANRNDLSKYYTARYIANIRKMMNESCNKINTSGANAGVSFDTLSDDEVFFYSIVFVIRNGIGWPHIKFFGKQSILVVYNIQAPINFELKLYGKCDSDNDMVFDSIENFEQLVVVQNRQLKPLLSKPIENY